MRLAGRPMGGADEIGCDAGARLNPIAEIVASEQVANEDAFGNDAGREFDFDIVRTVGLSGTNAGCHEQRGNNSTGRTSH